MCRWLAYKGKSIYLEDWLLNTEHSLIEQSKSAELTKYEVNGDGFGLGWYGNKPEPGLFKSIRPAWNNANLKSLAGHVSSNLFLAHVRAATGTPIQETNSHPFQYKNWLMVHNGIIHQFELVKKDLIGHIDAQYFQYILGSTDSEILFYLLLSKGMQTNVQKALQLTIGLIEKIAKNYHIPHAIRMTLGISDGKSLWGIRYSSNGSSPTLYYSVESDNDKHVLIVSEPLDECSQCWTLVEESTILHITDENQMHLILI
jgi:glutamine amidotransferase